MQAGMWSYNVIAKKNITQQNSYFWLLIPSSLPTCCKLYLSRDRSKKKSKKLWVVGERERIDNELYPVSL